jgi:hypothetical protein
VPTPEPEVTPQPEPEPVADPEVAAEPEAPAAEQEAEPKWIVSFRLRPRTEFRYNNLFNLVPASARYKRTDNADALTNQTRLGVGFATPELKATLLIQHAAAWGAAGGDRLTDPGLGTHLASLRWMPNDMWWLEARRFELAYCDQRLLGSVGWSQVGRAWDGVRTGFVFQKNTGLDVFGAVYQNGSLQPASGFEGRVFEDDAALTGLYFHSKELSEFVAAADAYAIGDMRFDKLASSPQRQMLGTFGARVKGVVDPAELTVEGAYQTGSRCVPEAPADDRSPPTLDCTSNTVDVSSGFFDTDFAVKLGDFKPFAGFGMATGDDPTTDKNEGFFHLYPTGHKFLGLMDLIGPRNNVREIRVGTSAKFGRFTFKESIHHFTALQPSATSAGVEADTTLKFKINKLFSVQGGHSVFVPGDAVTVDGSNYTGVANWWYLQLVMGGSKDL